MLEEHYRVKNTSSLFKLSPMLEDRVRWKESHVGSAMSMFPDPWSQ